jgi:hypothetical protein
MVDINDLQLRLERKKGERDKVNKSIADRKRRVTKLERKLTNFKDALEIIQVVASATQKKVEFYFSNIPNLCLKSVFDTPFKLRTTFDIKRSVSECDLSFEDAQGDLYDPMEDCGYGQLDIANIGLRSSILALIKPVPESVLILDEPLRHVKGLDANRRAIQLMKNLSTNWENRYGTPLQIITIPDEKCSMEEIEKGADNIIRVAMENGKSFIEEQ